MYCKFLSLQKQSCNEQPCDGVWSQWSAYDTCTKNCNSGTKSRTRRCDKPHNGEDCLGKNGEKFGNAEVEEETKTCNTQRCTREWGDWGEYSPCDRNCGGETKSRTRLCMTEQGKV